MINYLVANQGSATYLVAVASAGEGEGIILQTGKAVIALGGFSGNDPILTAEGFAKHVSEGKVRFVLTGGGIGGRGNFTGAPTGRQTGGNDNATNRDGEDETGQIDAGNVGTSQGSSSVDAWVQAHCTVVPASTWSGSTSSQSGFGSRYDCQGAT
jgi:hypothetical protein